MQQQCLVKRRQNNSLNLFHIIPFGYRDYLL